METPYVSTVSITRKELVSRKGVGSKVYVEFSCTTNDLDDGYPKDESFPDIDDLANGSIMFVTDTTAIKVFDESTQTFVEWE